jgi:hypothetical protein
MLKKTGVKPTGKIEEVGHYTGDNKPKVEASEGSQKPNLDNIDWQKVGNKNDAGSSSQGA